MRVKRQERYVLYGIVLLMAFYILWQKNPKSWANEAVRGKSATMTILWEELQKYAIENEDYPESLHSLANIKNRSILDDYIINPLLTTNVTPEDVVLVSLPNRPHGLSDVLMLFGDGKVCRYERKELTRGKGGIFDTPPPSPNPPQTNPNLNKAE